jgi:hypothetical protein
MKTFIQTAKVLLIALLVVTAVSYAQAEWNNAPPYNPSDDQFIAEDHNPPAPLNATEAAQVKTGDLGSLATISADQFCLITGVDSETGNPELDCLDNGWDDGLNNTDTNLGSDSCYEIPYSRYGGAGYTQSCNDGDYMKGIKRYSFSDNEYYDVICCQL